MDCHGSAADAGAGAEGDVLMPAHGSRHHRQSAHLRLQAKPPAPRSATATGAASHDPLEWLAARLPFPLLLLALPFVTVGLTAVCLYAGLRYRFWDTAFGMAGCGTFVWFFLAYLGLA
ncbi:MAG: hypothetical protein JWP57_4012 [Spirosoma sp.]|nr:hypothetical protein [Spirosoma sp.]